MWKIQSEANIESEKFIKSTFGTVKFKKIEIFTLSDLKTTESSHFYILEFWKHY